MNQWLPNGMVVLTVLGFALGGPIGFLFLGATIAVFAYLWGVQCDQRKEEAEGHIRAQIEQEMRDAARTPEERDNIERAKIRDAIISRLPSYDMGFYMVVPTSYNPEYEKKFAPINERVEKDVERVLTMLKAERAAKGTKEGGK